MQMYSFHENVISRSLREWKQTQYFSQESREESTALQPSAVIFETLYLDLKLTDQLIL